MAVSLDKIQAKAPLLVSLAKAADDVTRELGLNGHKAEVDLVIDISGSMQEFFYQGKVQRLAEKALALATRFDDDGKIGVYTFNNTGTSEGDMTLENFGSFLHRISAGGGTSYAPVMREVLGRNAGKLGAGLSGFLTKIFSKDKEAPRSDGKKLPRLVLFITDGDNEDHSQAEQIIREASNLPIFWQFMAIGPNRNRFPFLCHLDEMPGRLIDNANFFVVDDPESISDTQLFEKLLGEYPSWLRLAESKALISA